jgi:hypothetical protein
MAKEIKNEPKPDEASATNMTMTLRNVTTGELVTDPKDAEQKKEKK